MKRFHRWRPHHFYANSYWYPHYYDNGWDDDWRWGISLRYYDDLYWWYYDDVWWFWDFHGLCWRAGYPRWGHYGWYDRHWPRSWHQRRWRFCW